MPTPAAFFCTIVIHITKAHWSLQTILSTSSTYVEAVDSSVPVTRSTAQFAISLIFERTPRNQSLVPLTSEVLVRNLTLAVAIAAVWTLSGCKKTGEGQYEVQKPVVGTETDTVNTPSVETGTVKDTITVPKVGTEKKEVTVPKVEVKKPKE